MSNRVHLRHARARFEVCESPSSASDPTPPFSFSTTIYRYAETDCVSASRRRRLTAHLEGVRYYGTRYYNPDLGRWINRDPIGEDGGEQLYLFSRNAAVDRIDLLGMANVALPGSGGGRGCSPGRPGWIKDCSDELVKIMPYPLEDIEWEGGPHRTPDPASIKCGECEKLVEIESLETKRYRERRFGLILKWFGKRWILKKWSIHSVYECLSFEDARWYSDDPLRIEKWDWEFSKQRVEYKQKFFSRI